VDRESPRGNKSIAASWGSTVVSFGCSWQSATIPGWTSNELPALQLCKTLGTIIKYFRTKKIIILLVLLQQFFFAQSQTKIIDMHIHSYVEEHFKVQPKDYYGNKGSVNAKTHFTETYNALKKFNIVKLSLVAH